MKQALRKEGKNITNWNCLHITISSMKMKNKEHKKSVKSVKCEQNLEKNSQRRV